MDSLVDRVVTELGDIDILVNNAAVSYVSALEDHTLADWTRVMDVNTNSVVFLTQAVGKRCMIPRGAGKVVNLSSIGGMAGTAIDGPWLTAYSASKAAVAGFTKALATEWGRFNINVNVIAPGNFPSAMTEDTLAPEHSQRVLMKTPLGRTGGRDDMKGVALFLGSEASRHVTGHVIPVDGGLTSVNYSSLPSTKVPIQIG
jgi:gluconate 5-dehydrogenase